MSTEGRKIRVGMVGGGGPNNFFGAPHRRAILMDNTAELTAGALRSDPEQSEAEAKRHYFSFGYPDYTSMIEDQTRLHENVRMDYVTIVTPNNSHYPIAKDALEHGFPVLCEKPLTMTVTEAIELQELAEKTDLPFGVVYTYCALPMVMLAREFVRNGDIGVIRKVEAWYPQGWLSGRTEDAGIQQAQWRVDPKKSGASGCGGDIGTHAYQFIRFVTGLRALEVSARAKTFVEDRALDDDFTVLARLSGGDAIATVSASQVTIGAQNDNGFRVIGSEGTAEWSMVDHQSLKVLKAGQPVQVFRQGADYGYFPKCIKPYLRLPSGHPEGFHEALANLHRTIEWTIRRKNGETTCPEPYPHPGVEDGADGMAFIEAAVASSNEDGAFVALDI